MLTDGIDGSLSSRRVVTFAAFLLCVLAFLANLFWGMKIEQFIYDSMSFIAMAGLGATVAEKFSSRNSIVQTAPQINTNTIPRYRGTPLPKQEDPLI